MAWWVVQHALESGLLALGIALVCRLGRFRPAIQHLLWLIVLLKLFVPPGLVWPWAPGIGPWATREIPPAEPPTLAQPLSNEPLNEAGALALLASLQEELLQAASEPEPSPAEAPISPPSQAESRLAGDSAWLPLLGVGIWLSGSVLVALRHGWQQLRWSRAVRRGQSPPGELSSLVAELAQKFGVRPPRVRVVPGLSSPCIWCGVRPWLLWPRALGRRLPQIQQQSIIAHELAHLRRRDHWTGWLLLAAGCLWWWNPVCWYVRRQLRFQAELACDAWVLDALPSQRRAYAEALLEVVQYVSQKAVLVPAMGMGGGPRQLLERRLTMIMRDRVPCKVPLITLLALALLAAAALPGWATDDLAPKQDPAPKSGDQIELKLEAVHQGKVTVEPTQQWVYVVQEGQDGLAGKKPAPDAERDRKLAEVEKKIQALLQEVQSLRGKPYVARITTKPRMVTAQPPTAALTITAPTQSAPVEITTQPQANAVYSPATPLAVTVVEGQPLSRAPLNLMATVVRSNDQVVNLTRAKYSLPHAKAEALAAFLREHVKAEVLETKVEGESLIVTTTPAVQQAIGTLITVIQGKTTGKAEAKEGKRFGFTINAVAPAAENSAGHAPLRAFTIRGNDALIVEPAATPTTEPKKGQGQPIQGEKK